MADWGQFEKFDQPAERTGEIPASCQVCEAMLPDAVDGTLSEAEQRAFNRHVAGCVVCARELEEAQRGAAWLGLLKQQAPEPSALLLERILAQTTGAETQATRVAVTAAIQASVSVNQGWAVNEGKPVAPPMWAASSLSAAVPVRRKVRVAKAWQTITGLFSLDGSLNWSRAWAKPVLQPRLAMTAAMAFFSVALTLNLTGVRLSTVSAASLRPATLRRTVADRGAAAVRSFQNMPVVYQTEARMSDLRNDWQQQQGERPGNSEQTAPQPDPAPQPETRPQLDGPDATQPKQPSAEKPQGSSHLDFAPVDLQGAETARKGV